MLASPSLNHLIRPREQRRGNRQAESFGGLEVDDELKLRGLLDRKVAGLGSFQDLVHVGGGTPPYLLAAWTIAQQASPLHPESVRIHSWQLCVCCQRDDLSHGGVTREWRSPKQDER